MHNETFLARRSAALPLAGSETALRLRLVNLVRGRRVFDLACCAGRWTAVAARAAAAIVATDPCVEQWSLAHRRPYDCRVSFASDLVRGRSLMPDPDCLMGASLLARLGPRAARERIERIADRCVGGMTLILLESGCPPDSLLREMLPGVAAPSIVRAEFVTLISGRLAAPAAEPGTVPLH